MISVQIKQSVLEKLNNHLINSSSNANAIKANLYNTNNVLMSATHTHSGPGGFLEYIIYQSTSLGVVQDTIDAMINGIFKSILMAHNDLEKSIKEHKKGRIFINHGLLLDASINRSVSAYRANPEEERSKYQFDADKEMTLLRFTQGETEVGSINWFSVHCTSMNNTNVLVSSDNKGLASLLLESFVTNNHKNMNVRSPYVAAFAQKAEGDVSPNIMGAFCSDSERPCQMSTSTCGGKSQLCNGRGPVCNTLFIPSFIHFVCRVGKLEIVSQIR